MHRADSFIHVGSVICHATAHYGLMRTLKHVKNSSSGLLPADPEADSIFNLKENERMTD